MKPLNSVIAACPPSGIRRFFDIAAEMDDVISLGVGEPDFVTGNIIGSNIYNVLFILGVTSLIKPIVMPASRAPASVRARERRPASAPRGTGRD